MIFRRNAPQQAKSKNGSAPTTSQPAEVTSLQSMSTPSHDDDMRQMWDAVSALLDDTTVNGTAVASHGSAAHDAVAGSNGAETSSPDSVGSEMNGAGMSAAAIHAAVESEPGEYGEAPALYDVTNPAAAVSVPVTGNSGDEAPADGAGGDQQQPSQAPPAQATVRSDPFYRRIFRPAEVPQQPAPNFDTRTVDPGTAAALAGAAAIGATAASNAQDPNVPAAAAAVGNGAVEPSADVGSGMEFSVAPPVQAAPMQPDDTQWGQIEAPASGQSASSQSASGQSANVQMGTQVPQVGSVPAEYPAPSAEWGNAPATIDPAVAAGAAAVLAAAPQPYQLRVPGSPFALPDGLDPNAVSIRGRNEGVAVEIGAGHWEDILNLLSYRLEQSSGFFRNGPVAVDVGGRPLNEYELSAMRNVMVSFEMDPSVVRTTSERTFQSGLAMGMAMTLHSADGAVVNETQKAIATGSPTGYYIYRGSLRSGQVFYRHEHVIVLGDVNPGAEVISDGDILVWGRLRGTAHAGARGSVDCVVGALDLDPVQLRIDRVIGAAQAGLSEKGPRWGGGRSAQRRPEIARLVSGRLVIEPWDEIRTPGGPILKSRRN